MAQKFDNNSLTTHISITSISRVISKNYIYERILAYVSLI